MAKPVAKPAVYNVKLPNVDVYISGQIGLGMQPSVLMRIGEVWHSFWAEGALELGRHLIEQGEMAIAVAGAMKKLADEVEADSSPIAAGRPEGTTP